MKRIMKSISFYLLLIGSLLLLSSGPVSATAPIEGEEALFATAEAPDALILLDLSGSMVWNPAGGSSKWGDASCAGPFYSSYGTGHEYDCSRIAIAKRAIFKILDDDGNGTINNSDEGSLNVRFGYMRYKDCGSGSEEQIPSYSYTSGCNKYIKAIGTSYSRIYCNSSSSCTITSGSGTSSCVNGESANGGTPLAASLYEAKLYLDDHKASDSYANCRKKFVILISDGADTYTCNGNGAECQSDAYKRRREVVMKAKTLGDAGYHVFVIGFGSGMPDYLENTLHWMAYVAGTDNPNQANSGNVSALDLSGVSSCQTESSMLSGTCYDSSGAHSMSSWYAPANDPGNLPLSGYAFIASNADQLGEALQAAISIIRQANYSFSQSSIQSSRTTDENFLYEGSFEPIDDDPFWRGHLKKYQISSTTGDVGSMLWDAGTVLQGTDAASRVIKTYKSGAMVDFTTANITPADLGITTGTTAEQEAQRDAIVGFIRGETTYNIEAWKLGDVFRSTPITVGTPSSFFEDARDENNAFAAHRSAHQRTSANGLRLIVSGANAGQFHAFKTSDGTEAWSFIPPNQLTKLMNISHNVHPTSLLHSYYVDGPVTVVDAWLGSGNGKSKSASDWKTLLIFALGRGTTSYAWSSSSSCDTGISATYSSTTPYYCGYHALNITDNFNPAYLWNILATSAQGPYFGDAWSKMMTHRVIVNSGTLEKWVGVIGAGYNAGYCHTGGCSDPKGKGLFVVDLTSGSILWSFTNADDTDNMRYSVPAAPAIVDTDNDGFIDTAYVGDMGGNIWRIKFCLNKDATSCSISNWTTSRFFDATGNVRPIFTPPAVAKDSLGNLWIYWGTGDKTDPTGADAQERFYAAKDNDRTTMYSAGDLQNITTSGGIYDNTSGNGYYINMGGQGEKILAEPTVFGGVVYFTTYTPVQGNDPCEQSGTATLYALNYTTGGGALSDGSRTMEVGQGIPSAPIVSVGPDGTPDLYVTTSGGGGASASTDRVNIEPPGMSNRANMLYWRDKRIAP